MSDAMQNVDSDSQSPDATGGKSGVSKKIPSTFATMLTVLLLISLISAGLLAWTYEGTKDRIAANQLAKQLAAIQAVLPAYDNDILADKQEVDGSELFPAFKGGTLVGAAVMGVTQKGFGGEMDVMVGFDPSGVMINAIAVKLNETPGLGTKVNDEKFNHQFHDRQMNAGETLSVVKDGGTIDAITAATISSRAFTDAVNKAWASAETYFGGAK